MSMVCNSFRATSPLRPTAPALRIRMQPAKLRQQYELSQGSVIKILRELGVEFGASRQDLTEINDY